MQQIKEFLAMYRREVVIAGIIVVALVGFFLASGKGQPSPMPTAQNQPVVAHSSRSARRSRTVVVDVKGAVNKPGVYRLAHGDRIAEAVNHAGGFRNDADSNQVNLAKQVSDQQMIYIPMKGEQVTADASGSVGDQADKKTVNLNTASKEQLTTITALATRKQI